MRLFVNNTRKQRGFTLIEVMLAMVFVAMGITTVLQVMSAYVRNISELEKRTLASWVASNHIAEIRFASETERIKTGSKTERISMGGYEWRSRAKISQTEVEKVFLLEVEVFEDGPGERNTYAAFTTAVTENSL